MHTFCKNQQLPHVTEGTDMNAGLTRRPSCLGMAFQRELSLHFLAQAMAQSHMAIQELAVLGYGKTHLFRSHTILLRCGLT